MNVKTQAVLKTTKQIVVAVLIALAVDAVVKVAPFELLAFSLIVGVFAGAIYTIYQLNLDQLKSKQYAKLRSEESQRCEKELKDRLKQLDTSIGD